MEDFQAVHEPCSQSPIVLERNKAALLPSLISIQRT